MRVVERFARTTALSTIASFGRTLPSRACHGQNRLNSVCPGSAHVRRGGVSLAAASEILGWGEIAKRLVRSDVAEMMREAIDQGLQRGDAAGQFVAGIELVSPG